jgi:hypothetical protein
MCAKLIADAVKEAGLGLPDTLQRQSNAAALA